MSAFMSPKYRRLSGHPSASEGALVVGPAPCAGCGYDLHGLRRGGACPECGSRIPTSGIAGARPDRFLALDVRQRGAVRLGATVAAIGLLLVAVEPLATLILGVAGAVVGWSVMGSTLPIAVPGVRFLACVSWVGAGLIAVPAPLWDGDGRAGDFRRRARVPVLMLLAGWPVGQLLGMVAVHQAQALAPGGPAGWVMTASGLSDILRVLGGAAAAIALHVLASAAADAELEPDADRLAAGAVVLPLLGFVIWATPSTMPWIFLLLYALVLLLPWAWFAWRTGTGMLGVARHVMWATRIGRQAAGREDRIAARRAALDAEWKARVRPLPDEEAARATERRAGRVCRRCGGDMRSRPGAGRCPTCGGEALA